MLDLLWLPFLCCLVLTGIHVYLGLHVLARGGIFVDLALSQVAALGVTVGLLAGLSSQADAPPAARASHRPRGGAGARPPSRRVGRRLLRLVRAGGDELGAPGRRAP